jgi:hypothetical protein
MHYETALEALTLALASGRVAYSLVHDEIMRPLRERIWLRYAPESGTIRDYADDGSFELRIACMIHKAPTYARDSLYLESLDRFYSTQQTPRPATFLGQLFECHYCMSFWTSLLAAAAWLLLGDLAVTLAVPFAIWAIANTYAQKAL